MHPQDTTTPTNPRDRTAQKAAYYQAHREEAIAYAHAYQERNKERIAAQAKVYYQQNKERVNARTADYRRQHPEWWAAIQRGHYQRHKEEHNAKSQAYRLLNKERIATQAKIFREANKERLAARVNAYRQENKEAISAQKKARYQRDRTQIIAKVRAYCQKNREQVAARQAVYHQKSRREAMEAYGGTKCALCGVTEFAFLTIDHVNGGGKKDQRESRGQRGIIPRLKREGWPEGYQVLCANCNAAKWRANQRGDSPTARYGRRLRMLVLEAYGGRCACCGEADLLCLEVDHVNGDGAKDRMESGGYLAIYRRLRNEGWPKEGYQVLCANCNMAKERPGGCPHQAA